MNTFQTCGRCIKNDPANPMGRCFGNADCPGFSSPPPLPPLDRDRFLERIAIALERLVTNGVTLTIKDTPLSPYEVEALKAFSESGGEVGRDLGGALSAREPPRRPAVNGDTCSGCGAVVERDVLAHRPDCPGNI